MVEYKTIHLKIDLDFLGLDEEVKKAIVESLSESGFVVNAQRVNYKRHSIPNCFENYQIITNCDGQSKSIVLHFFINKELITDYINFGKDFYKIKTVDMFKEFLKDKIELERYSLIKDYQFDFIFNCLFVR